VRPYRTLYRLLFGLTALSLFISVLLIFGTTPQQQHTWPVAAVMNVTYVEALLGFFALVLWGISTRLPWWSRIMLTIGSVCGFLYIGYFTLLQPFVPPSMHWLEPALNSLWIVALVCLLLGSSRARRRASR